MTGVREETEKASEKVGTVPEFRPYAALLVSPRRVMDREGAIEMWGLYPKCQCSLY